MKTPLPSLTAETLPVPPVWPMSRGRPRPAAARRGEAGATRTLPRTTAGKALPLPPVWPMRRAGRCLPEPAGARLAP
jgi:hypothetical protein